MTALLASLKALGPTRLAAMGAVALAVLGLLAVLALYGGTQRMALLYADLDLREASQATDTLDHQHIPYQLAANGTEILVPADQVPRARMLLAKDGLPSGGSIGYELFDHADSLTASEFQQTINQTRALEGELARSIRALHGVRAARVHLVLPKREPFAREQQPAQASVLLTMAGGARLDREGVQAVLNLVAAAVPGLKPRSIAIIDSRGTLLARAGEPVPEATALSTEELRHATELRLAHAVEEMLESSLGPGHVRAEASVDMDYGQLRETQERYDPDGQVMRSQQTISDTSKTTEKTAGVSVQNNLPNADAGKTTNGTDQKRQEETTNYEIGKTVRTLVQDQPRIRRISLAVMVDGVTSPGPNNKPVWHARSAAELAQLQTLVQGAIGFDAKRGDSVQIASMKFANTEFADSPASPTLLGLIDKADIMHLAQMALFAVVALLAVLFVLRPMATRLTALPLAARDAAATQDATLAAPTDAPALSDGSPPAGLLEGDGMMDVANIDGQIRASSIRRVAALADQHPDQTLAIVRGWMVQEQNGS